jgi:hypothetical protein
MTNQTTYSWAYLMRSPNGLIPGSPTDRTGEHQIIRWEITSPTGRVSAPSVDVRAGTTTTRSDPHVT